MEDASLGVLVFASFLLISLPLVISGFGVGVGDQEGDVRLVGGSHGLEGRAEIYHDGAWLGICLSSGDTAVPTTPATTTPGPGIVGIQHEWEFPEADVFCNQIGYAEGAALIFDGTQTAAKFGNPTSTSYLTNIDCATNTNVPGLLSCNGVTWGSTCDDNLGYVGLVCRIPGFEGCYLHSPPSFLNGHVIVSNTMTLATCLDLCTRPPGPYKYAGVRQDHCECGNTVQQGFKVDDHQCFNPCLGDDEQPCGSASRTAIYDLGTIASGNAAPHIIWPIWGNDYNAGDNGKVVRVMVPTGYDYAVLNLLSFDLADSDSIILKSEARQAGTTLSGSLNLKLPWRWITNSATWFEVETVVIPTTTGGDGIIMAYEFGKHCSALDLPDIPGGNWRAGVYYDQECPLPICNAGYQPASSALCQLDGTWKGTGSCTHIPVTRAPLFPPDPPATPPPTASPTQTQPPPPPPPPATQPPPPVTQPPPPATNPPPNPPEPTREPGPPPVIPTQAPLPPPAQCYLPNIDRDTGTLIGTGFRAVFYQNDRITHCCTHKVSDCMELVCQSDMSWTNLAYMSRCPRAVCTAPITNENGRVNNPDRKLYFEDREELGLCCIHSDYCFVLRCLDDGVWDNMDQLLLCPGPQPPPTTDTDFPVWLIAVLIAAGIFGLAIILICVIVCCCWPQQRKSQDKKPLTYTKDPSPYIIDTKDGYNNPYLNRSPSPTRKRDAVEIGYIADPKKDYRDYNQYGANPTIIGGGSKYQSRHPDNRNQSRRRDDRQDRRRDDRRDDRRDSRRDERRDPRRDERQDPRREERRDDRRDQRERRDRRERRSENPPRRREVDEASALGALNNVVQDLADIDSVSSAGASSQT